MNVKREKIGDKIHFCSIKDERYKTNSISVNLITKLDENTVSANAMIPNLVDKSNSDYPEYDEFTKKLNGMYKAEISAFSSKIGNAQIITVSGNSIDNKYAMENENLCLETAQTVYNCVFKPALFDGRFIDDRFENEKGNLVDDINAEINDKRTYAVNKATQIMFENQPCGINKLGTAQNAERLTNIEVLNAYKKLILEAEIEVVFSGCGEDEDIKEFFKEKLSLLNGKRASEVPEVIKTTRNEVKEVTEKMKVAQSKMVIGFKTDDEDEASMRMMTALFGGTPSSKLFKNVREKMSLCYYCTARYSSFTHCVTVDCGVENDNIEKAKNEIIRQLDLMKNGEVSIDEVTETKLALQNSFKSFGDSPTALESWYITRILASDLNSPEDISAKVGEIDSKQIIKSAQSLTLDTVYVLTGEDE